MRGKLRQHFMWIAFKMVSNLWRFLLWCLSGSVLAPISMSEYLRWPGKESTVWRSRPCCWLASVFPAARLLCSGLFCFIVLCQVFVQPCGTLCSPVFANCHVSTSVIVCYSKCLMFAWSLHSYPTSCELINIQCWRQTCVCLSLAASMHTWLWSSLAGCIYAYLTLCIPDCGLVDGFQTPSL